MENERFIVYSTLYSIDLYTRDLQFATELKGHLEKLYPEGEFFIIATEPAREIPERNITQMHSKGKSTQKWDIPVTTNEPITDTSEGKKYDSNKSMAGTLCGVFPNALLAIGNCIEFGTHKYPDPANWQKVDGAFKRYQDSIMRHYLKFLAGQEKDAETGLPHLAHMAWNTLAVLELYLREHISEYEKELYK